MTQPEVPTPLGTCERCGHEITGAGYVEIRPTGRRAYHDECPHAHRPPARRQEAEGRWWGPGR